MTNNNQAERSADQPALQPKPERPRDELGRPLPRGSVNQLELEDFDANSLEENHRLAVGYFSTGRFFEAHEAWETCWNQAKGGPDEEFFKGLSQLGAGYTHYRRGNARGAAALMQRGLGRIDAYGPAHHGLAIEPLVTAAREHALAMEAAAESDSPPPDLPTPRLDETASS